MSVIIKFNSSLLNPVILLCSIYFQVRKTFVIILGGMKVHIRKLASIQASQYVTDFKL